MFGQIGCAVVPHAELRRSSRDRRVADVETVYDPMRGILNRLFATASPLTRRCTTTAAAIRRSKCPRCSRFEVQNIYTDFKRHDLGPALPRAQLRRHDAHAVPDGAAVGRRHHGAVRHDGRSINLTRGDPAPRRRGAGVARPRLRALPATHAAAASSSSSNTLVLFPPDDTASNLDPGDRGAGGLPAVRARQHQADRAVQRSDRSWSSAPVRTRAAAAGRW